MFTPLLKAKKALPESITFDLYNHTKDYPDHSYELLMEAAVNAWEYVLENGTDEFQTLLLPNCASWEFGVVELRHAIIYMSNSILEIYEQLYKIEDDLPCYDLEIVPAIVRLLDRYLLQFSKAGMDVIVTPETAKQIAQICAVGSVHVYR